MYELQGNSTATTIEHTRNLNVSMAILRKWWLVHCLRRLLRIGSHWYHELMEKLDPQNSKLLKERSLMDRSESCEKGWKLNNLQIRIHKKFVRSEAVSKMNRTIATEANGRQKATVLEEMRNEWYPEELPEADQ